MPNDTNSSNIIAFDDVSKTHPPKGDVALRNVSFTVAKGEFFCIIGPSGSGKSSILKLIAGLDASSSGTVIKPDHISMVFQSGALLPWLTVFENVALGLRAAHTAEHEIHTLCTKYIEMMGLQTLEKQYPRELSGGQRQRVGIARALAVSPAVLLLDEPFSSLDPKTTEELHKDVLKIWRDTGTTIVMVSHSIEEAVSLADRIMLIKNFTVDRIFTITLPRPRHEHGEKLAREVLQIRHEFFK